MPDKSKSKIDEFVRAGDEAHEFSDASVDAFHQQALEEIDDLFRSLDNRDEELWDDLGADDTDTIADLEDEDNEDRDLMWLLGMSWLSMASTVQGFLDNREDLIIRPVAYREQLLDGFDLSSEELVSAGKRGSLGSAVEIVGRFETVQAKYLDDLSFLRDMDNVELFRTLRKYNALPSPAKILSDSMGYVSRMTEYKAGTDQWKGAVADLINHDSTRVMKGINRQAVRGIYQERDRDGDDSRPMVWIGEGGNPCGPCQDRFGEIKTWAQWVIDGMPPTGCLGNWLCKCVLYAVR